MGKRIYVNGGILVNTRYFMFSAGAECLSLEQPEDTIFLDPTDEVEGSKCLIIDDEHPRSIFDKYYAKTFITVISNGTEYYRYNYSDCFNETKEELNELENLISSLSSIESGVKNSLMKFLYINIVTIIDSFICSIILTGIFKNEEIFLKYYNERIGNSDKVRIEKYLISDNRGQWEKEIVDIILHTPFENMERIKKSFGSIGLKKPQDPGGIMANHFDIRNVLVHRNGKKKDGKRIIITEENVRQLLADTTSFIDIIQKSIPQEV